jgi:chromosome partitioning protein
VAYVVTFANQKGGVGKTTTVHNVLATLAARGRRVCAIDADPQANLSRSAGCESVDLVKLEDLLLNRSTPDTAAALVELPTGGFLLPTSAGLATIIPALQQHPDYAAGLGRILEPIEERFDFVLIDTPPGINQWSSLALLAADGVVIPAQPHDLDVNAAADTWDFVEDEVRHVNPDVQVLGVLITRTHRNRRLLREAREAFAQQEMPTFESWIPAQESVASSMRWAEPTVVREPDSRAGRAYESFADELLQVVLGGVAS